MIITIYFSRLEKKVKRVFFHPDLDDPNVSLLCAGWCVGAAGVDRASLPVCRSPDPGGMGHGWFQAIGLGLGAVGLPAAILLGYAILFGGLAVWRFQFES